MTMLTFTPDGNGHGLYTEVIDLNALGPLSVTRATSIEFNQQTQRWEVRDSTGVLRHSHRSRQQCLNWEHRHFNQ